MPTLAIVLLVYYAVVLIIDVARGPRAAEITPLGNAVRLLIGSGLILAWLSLPFCAGIPLIVWGIVAWYGLSMVSVLAYTGRSVDITPGVLVVEAGMIALYIIVLLTTGFCA
jgi:hypothetical protein